MDIYILYFLDWGTFKIKNVRVKRITLIVILSCNAPSMDSLLLWKQFCPRLSYLDGLILNGQSAWTDNLKDESFVTFILLK